jgi:acyl-CoA reductase-like NAD-dependent aldehyde dehydrogenase
MDRGILDTWSSPTGTSLLACVSRNGAAKEVDVIKRSTAEIKRVMDAQRKAKAPAAAATPDERKKALRQMLDSMEALVRASTAPAYLRAAVQQCPGEMIKLQAAVGKTALASVAKLRHYGLA